MSPSDRDPIAEVPTAAVGPHWKDAADRMAAITSLMRARQIALSRAEAVPLPLGISFAR